MKGSVRSKAGIHVLDLFSEAKDLIIASGGHECAGGFSLKESDLDAFKEKIYAYCDNKTFIESVGDYINISLNEVTKENLEILENFAPFGNGFKAPDFKISNYPTRSFSYSADKKHIITKISNNSSLVCFNYDNDIHNHKYVDFIGNYRANYFRNRKNLNFIIKKMLTKD